jgi:hypothetical protein
MAYTYSSLIAALQIEAVQLATDPNWLGIIATVIDDSEQRCYRDLDLVSCIVKDTSGSLTANSRNFVLPQSLGYFMSVKGMNVVISGVRQQLRPVSIHFIDATWPSDTSVAGTVPQYFAYLSDQNYVIGPSPSTAYGMEVFGTIRPTPLSVSNTTTYLTQHLSDLFFAGCMASIAGYMRNYGEQADDPKMAQSWEAQYAQRLSSANREEMRRKYQSGDWTSETRPNPVATPGQ